MMVSFWGAVLTQQKSVTVTPPEGYVLNLQMAALGAETGKKFVVKVETEDLEDKPVSVIICTLRPNVVEQVKLDLAFGWESPVTFTLTGSPGSVHLSGYFQPGPDEDFVDGDLACDDEEDYTPEELEQMKKQMQSEMNGLAESSSDDDEVRFEELVEEDQPEDDESNEDEKDNKKPIEKANPAAKKQNKPVKPVIKQAETKKAVAQAKKVEPKTNNKRGAPAAPKANNNKKTKTDVTWDQDDSSDDVKPDSNKVDNKPNTEDKITPKKKRNRKKKGKGNAQSPAL